MNKSPPLRRSPSSVDSLMEDTPTNYNIANQRYENMKDLEDVEPINEVESGVDDDSDIMSRLDNLNNYGRIKNKKKKKKRYKEVSLMVPPGKKDLEMAKAYGAQLKPHVLTKVVPVKSKRGISSRRGDS